MVLVAVGVSTMLATITTSMVNVALPTLADEFTADITTVQWVALIFFIVVSSLHLTTGRYGDIYGRRGAFVLGAAVFGVASLACGLAPDIGWLIAGRVAAAIGAALMQSNGTAILVAVFPPAQRSRAIGLWFTLAALGLAIGPLLAGTVIELADWRWMFFALVPLAAATLVLAIAAVPHLPGTGEGNFDVLSAVLLLGWVTPLIFAINRGFAQGLTPEVGIALAAFGAFGASFAVRTEIAPNPLLDLKLFKRADFSTGVVVGLAGFGCMAAIMLNGPFVLERVMGISAFQVGMLMAIYPAVGGLSAPLIGWWADRIGNDLPRTIGFPIAAAAYLVFALTGPDQSLLPAIVGLLLLGLATGLIQTANNSIIMGSVPRTQLGTAGAFIAASRTFGFGAGQSFWGGLFAFLVLLEFSGARAIDAPLQLQADNFAIGFRLAAVIMIAAGGLSFWRMRRERANPSIAGH